MITQPCNTTKQLCNLATEQSQNNAFLQHNNHATFNATIMQPSRNLSTQQSLNNNANFQRNNHVTFQVCRASLPGKSAGQVCRASLTPPHAVHNLNFICQIGKFFL
jgi:hypothetical protein